MIRPSAALAIRSLLRGAPLILFFGLCVVFGSLSDRFLEPQNLINILVQSSSLGIAAIGMTLVLLTAGVDLSVGSVMFVSVAVSGILINRGYPIGVAFVAAVATGVVVGCINGFLVAKCRLVSFIATLGMLFVIRGFGLWLTETRAMNMPDSVTALGARDIVGIPTPIVALALVALATSFFLRRTSWGRQIYAVGQDATAATKAGIRVTAILTFVYVACGALAATAGVVALTQTGAVSPTFGESREFAAIAAAVLGGTSLFGGRGTVIPGAIFGAVLFQTVENALNIINADPYLYPIILSGIIFLAVLVDVTRNRLAVGSC